jgi:hypothetical protein
MTYVTYNMHSRHLHTEGEGGHTGSGGGDCILHNTRDRASSDGAFLRDDPRRLADALQVEDEFVV